MLLYQNKRIIRIMLLYLYLSINYSLFDVHNNIFSMFIKTSFKSLILVLFHNITMNIISVIAIRIIHYCRMTFCVQDRSISYIR